MTPKEKAEELVDKMSKQTYSIQPYAGARYITEEIGWEGGKKCALIAVDELINCSISYDNYNATWASQVKYWEEVKQEIEKL